MNDLTKVCQRVNCVLFANDTSIIPSKVDIIKSMSELFSVGSRMNMKIVIAYRENKNHFNKTNFDWCINLDLDGLITEQVGSFKYLGFNSDI